MDSRQHPDYGPCDALGRAGRCSECQRLGLDNAKTVNVDNTAAHIDFMASRLMELSREMERVAELMREKQDLTYAQEAINVVTGGISNLRLDLLISRPLKELL